MAETLVIVESPSKAKTIKKERDQLKREANDIKYGLDLLIQED